MQVSAESKFDDDEEDLLAFVSDLDYNKYIGDMEVHSMMDRVRQRIAALEKEIVKDEQRDGEASERTTKRRQQLDEQVNPGS